MKKTLIITLALALAIGLVGVASASSPRTNVLTLTVEEYQLVEVSPSSSINLKEGVLTPISSYVYDTATADIKWAHNYLTTRRITAEATHVANWDRIKLEVKYAGEEYKVLVAQNGAQEDSQTIVTGLAAGVGEEQLTYQVTGCV